MKQKPDQKLIYTYFADSFQKAEERVENDGKSSKDRIRFPNIKKLETASELSETEDVRIHKVHDPKNKSITRITILS